MSSTNAIFRNEGETSMITEPKLEDRPAQPYVTRRTQVPMQELGTVIPQLHSEVYARMLTRFR